MMLRGEGTRAGRAAGIALAALVGAGCAALVALGNPGHMGICGACFLRDLAGALGLSGGRGPACFRPEVPGLLLGALALALARGRAGARSGSHAVTRFAFGVWMGIAALVFLGCPFRMLQRLGGGDLNAWLALPGFLAGVGVAMLFEARGYHVGRTAPVPLPVGLVGPALFAGLLALFLAGGPLQGPGPGAAGGPPHAPWWAALAIAGGAGALLSATGFCAVTAARQVWRRQWVMPLAALALIAGYGAVAAATGRFHAGFAGQPVAHGDWLWSALALALLGITGALAGGCPVRQMVMAGEGNGDAFVTVAGLVVGGALAHTMGLASTAASATAPGGSTPGGRWAVLLGLALSLVYAAAIARRAAPPPAAAAGDRLGPP
jgi:YedE family putative selenium metabolism protein